MPSVEIPQDLFERLQSHAKPFVDSPASVISRAIDALEINGQPSAEPVVLDARGRALPEFEALYPPSLTFTKVVAAAFDGKPVTPANWNRLLDAALLQAAKRAGSFEKLRKIASVNIVRGKKTDDGYHFLPTADFSVQGQDANGAWRGVVIIAQNLKCPVEVSFLWRNKEGAAHPGKPGTMRLD